MEVEWAWYEHIENALLKIICHIRNVDQGDEKQTPCKFIYNLS